LVQGNPDNYENTALHMAAIHDHAAICKSLLAAGANKDAKTKPYGYTPLHHAVAHGKSVPIINILLAAGADVNAIETEGGETPLHKAAKKGFVAGCEALLAAGANTEVADGRDYNPPIVAGHDLRGSKYDGRTALHVAADCGHTAVCKALLAGGANKDAHTLPSRIGKRYRKWTARTLATDKGHRDLAKLL
jgi:ankyrin repeat protein